MRRVLIAIVAAATMSSSALAQCADWLARGIEMQYTGGVYDAVQWDPDGPSGQPPLLIIGGNFELANGPGIPTANLATWNGSTYGTLGSFTGGNSSYTSVSAVAVYNG